MNRIENLLVIFAEECSEVVAQACSKALRFGLDDIAPGQELTNRAKISQELGDLIAVAEILQEKEIIGLVDYHLVEEKKKKVAKWLAYSIEKGCVK